VSFHFIPLDKLVFVVRRLALNWFAHLVYELNVAFDVDVHVLSN
jgi:hypothetical protein